MSRFYIVQRAGVPAVWQSDPEHIHNLLLRHTGYTITTAGVSGSRREALVLLRELFPGSRPIKTLAQQVG